MMLDIIMRHAQKSVAEAYARGENVSQVNSYLNGVIFICEYLATLKPEVAMHDVHVILDETKTILAKAEGGAPCCP